MHCVVKLSTFSITFRQIHTYSAPATYNMNTKGVAVTGISYLSPHYNSVSCIAYSYQVRAKQVRISVYIYVCFMWKEGCGCECIFKYDYCKYMQHICMYACVCACMQITHLNICEYCIQYRSGCYVQCCSML